MKATPQQVKRRWRGPALAVLALVVCSLLVPVAFLFGRFPAGYVTDERLQQEIRFHSFGQGGRYLPEDVEEEKALEDNVNLHTKTNNDSANHVISNSTQQVVPMPPTTIPKAPPALSMRNDKKKKKKAKGLNDDETEESCQVEFGSYCLWSIENKEAMKDLVVKKLKDQLFQARAYYPSITKLRGEETLSRLLKQNIQEHERMLSEAIIDADLPPLIGKKIKTMDQTIARAKSHTADCNNVDKKLRQILDLTEDEAHFHMKQSAFLYNLGVQTMPKSLHCLSMRLTVEYFKSPPVDLEHLNVQKFDIPKYRHYIVFSRNVLAASVVINSTVMSSEVTGNMVFHLLTDSQNYYAMKFWFARNSYMEAAVQVINYDEHSLENLRDVGLQQLYLSEEFRVSIRNIDQPAARMSTEYLSIFSHSHFLLPEIFKKLKKVIILDDDVVIQHDLSSLWNLDLGEKVNGAVNFCRVRFGQLKRYLRENSYDDYSCSWMSGVNIVDLEKWREFNVTGKYLQILQQFQSRKGASLQAAALPISLLAFQDLIYPLNDTWSLSGLGYDYDISEDAISSAVSLHYNGNMKPWLELGIPDHKKYWKKFLTQEERFLDECNVHL
ncbi:probable galacturonosyltransferase 7 isoform X2 [Typha angustifolia]|uniref:probable galacturonosyltransferase 7 isoform X2 n=1 Tax=Typha angustifolia TaxID=59011 RepID=UPI003C2EA838